MKTVRTLALLSLLSLTSSQALASSPEATAALQKLDAARSTLTTAVQRIQKDPPSNSDLDAAAAAVEGLKNAIDAGAANEEKDLDYAKAALAARKELRTQREYVEQRRAKIFLFEHRRIIDAALAQLGEQAKRVEAKAPTPQDFEAARAALQAARKAADDARPFVGKDEAFAGYIAEVDGKLARHEKAIDDRQVLLQADRQRGLLEESRKSLSASMGALKQGSSDAQFKDAERAMGAVNQRLEEGKFLEPKDKAYRADAERARSEVAQAKKRMDDLWSAQGLARLTGEIEPAHQDLITASKALKGKEPTPDQLAEAKTAAFVVRKVLEKFRPEAERSQAFAQYVAGVKKTLVEVEVDLQRRSLATARAAVLAALKPVERRAPTEEQFKAAETALADLDKTLRELPEIHAPLAERVAELKTLLQTGRETVAKRRAESGLEGAQAAVTRSLRPLEKKSPTEEQFKEAETALAALEKTLEGIKPKDAAQAVADARAQLRDGKATLAKRRAEVSLGNAKAAVAQALRPLEKRAPTDEQFAEAGTALTVLEKTLETVKSKDAPEAVADAKAWLRDWKATYLKRRAEVSLESAKAGVLEVLRPIEGDSPSDEQFKEANTALTVLEKTLESVKKKDAPAAYVDAYLVLRNAQKTLSKRRVQIDVGLQRVRVEKQRDNVAEAMELIQRADAGDKQLQDATAAVQQLQKALDEGTALVKVDKEYSWFDHVLRKEVATLHEKIAKRRIVLAANEGKEVLSVRLGTAKEKLDTAGQPSASDGDLDGAAKSVDAVSKALEERAALEQQDAHYAANAANARDELSRLQSNLEFVKRAHALRSRIVGELTAGTSTSNAAASAGDIRAQKAQYEKALSHFRSCEEAGSLFEKDRQLAAIGVLVDGRLSSPKEAIGVCVERAKSTRQLLAGVEGLIAFEEGPRPAYEKAKALLEKKKKNEALEQFGECIATGRILQARNPELSDRKFQVGKTTMTLAQVIEECMKNRDALLKK